MPGPDQKHPDHRARTNKSLVVMTQLPAEGRTGRAPAWPLSDDQTLSVDVTLARSAIRTAKTAEAKATTPRQRADARKSITRGEQRLARAQAMLKANRLEEAALWRDLWKTPQATQWEKLGWTRDVAQYVRHKVRAEGGSLDHAKEARMQADRLGLTPLAMRNLKWEVVDIAAAKPEVPVRRSKRNATKYSNLRVV